MHSDPSLYHNGFSSAPVDLVIFGGTGDLSFRKLLPALYSAFACGRLREKTRVLSLGRKPLTSEEFRTHVDERLRAKISATSWSEDCWSAFLDHIDYLSIDATCPAEFKRLAEALRVQSQTVFYFATSPDLFIPMCYGLSTAGLTHARTSVVLEKPLGNDAESAREINNCVARYFNESQIFRIDHYLGKESVQNLIFLRFSNAVFRHIWQTPHIKSVQLTVSESLGVEGRAEFYDRTGALKDMVKNHMLQLLAIVAMDPPTSFESDAVRDEKVKVLRALRPISGLKVLTETVRAQYRANDDAPSGVTGYRQERGVPRTSRTETFVALRAFVDTPRWSNVPFILRTGKRLASKASEIVIDFDDEALHIPDDGVGVVNSRLVIRLEPEASVSLVVNANNPTDIGATRLINLDLDPTNLCGAIPMSAYERLLLDVMAGRQAHFVRSDELDVAWRWVDAIVRGWQQTDARLHEYAVGSEGPEDVNWAAFETA